MSARRQHGIAATWGFAEATLFFFVPDVFLTWLALERPKRAFVACGFALLGALLGGVAILVWGGSDAASARSTLDSLPGIHPALFERASSDLADRGTAALFTGPRLGVPYKIYALEWGALGGNLGSFLLMSVPARLLRFLLTTALASVVSRRLLARTSLRVRRLIHIGFWLTFYAWYFFKMGI